MAERSTSALISGRSVVCCTNCSQASGRFCGETISDTLAAVLERDPDWSALPRRTPARIRKLLRRCLDRDADSRLSSIQSAREEIVKVRRRFSRRQLATLGVASFAILAAGAAVYLRSPARPAARSEWVQLTNFPDSVSQPALSPDGRMLTFVRSQETFAAPGEIYVKTLPNGEPVQLTRDGLRKMSPVFSPDASRIAYTVVTHGDQVWDTWVVPSGGGQARPWLTGASGLVWFDRQHLLFSEIEHDIHMGVVTADENGGGKRSVYFPAGRRGMVHRSYPSPNRRWAVLVEMDRGLWLPCRLVPMDGGSTGRPIGPPGGACTVAGWSPDGKWIYLNSSRGGTYHIWRQRFPDGKPEQLTSGPTEEEGIAVTPNGSSLITSVGLRQSVVFVHSPSGDRQVSREGFSYDPKFTPDGKKLCYRISKGVGLLSDPSELRVVDLDSGHSEPLLPGLQIFGQAGFAYDVSPDGKQVVAAARDPEGKGRLWLAALDQQSPARQIPNIEGDSPRFGVGGEVIFRVIETPSSAFLYRVNQDGSQLRKAVEQPVAALRGISPDGRWLVARVQTETSSTQMAFPLQGGIPVPLHSGESWWWNWSTDQRLLYISVVESVASLRTYVIPLARGRALPPIPEGEFQRSDELAKLPGVRIIDAFVTAPGPNRSVYAFPRANAQRNLYRIPLQ